MPLCKEINLFHVHNPRCAGTSINKVLFEKGYLKLKSLKPKFADKKNFYGNEQFLGKRLELDHLPISQILARLDLIEISQLHFFSIVRHPWDRFVSDFYRKKMRNDNRFININDLDLHDYLEIFLRKTDPKIFFRNQFRCAHYWHQEMFANFWRHPDIKKFSILKFENLNEDWNNLQDKLGFSAPLGNKPANSSSFKDTTNQKEKLMKTELYSKFKEFYYLDYKLFGYY